MENGLIKSIKYCTILAMCRLLIVIIIVIVIIILCIIITLDCNSRKSLYNTKAVRKVDNFRLSKLTALYNLQFLN